jgi:FdhE protein
VLQQRPELGGWTHPHCGLCGGEPEFAVITPAAERHLICGRCALRWKFEPLTCPYCRNADRSRITSFATTDGQYRVYACDQCRRYLKAYDGRRATRPVMPMVDTVATLPLDAAAMQKGYSS